MLVNGDIFVREDIDKVRAISGASSFLIARGALNNASIFRKEGMLPYTDVRDLCRKTTSMVLSCANRVLCV